MTKKGRFSEDEKIFVRQNYLQMSDSQLAEALNRQTTAIVNFRRRENLTKADKVASVNKQLDVKEKRQSFVSALPEDQKKAAYISEIKASSAFRSIKSAFTKDELAFYQDRYVEFMMDPTIETMTATEKDALHRKTCAEIRQHRFMEDEKIFRESGQPQNRSREIAECAETIWKCEKSLNVTREQRLKDGQDQSINFTAIIKELQDPRLRQKIGYEASMFKFMAEMQYNDRLGDQINAGDDETYDIGKNFTSGEAPDGVTSDFLLQNDDDDE